MNLIVAGIGDVDEEFIDILKQHIDGCKTCQLYAPTIPKPAVGNLFDPDKMNFNEIVSLDLKHRNTKMILYMIDVVARFTRATFVRDKTKEVVINAIIKLWLSLFGAPNSFISDNGGEFANSEMRELGNQYGINIKHTAAYAPWANGINERNHATVDVMMNKMMEDMPDAEEDVILQYCVSVRNTCINVHGFTPAQLVFGQNPRLPSTFSDELPALSGTTTSPIILDHLNNLNSARKAFAATQNSIKLRIALNKPVRSYSDVVYQPGDEVYYLPAGETK